MNKYGPEIPNKVAEKALDLGAEIACIAIGPENSCPKCNHLVMIAFDIFYGDLPDAEVEYAITRDHMADEANDRSN